MMNPISANAISTLLQSLGVEQPSSATKAISNILVIVFLQSAVSKSDIAVTNELTKVFLENDDLRAEFIQQYYAEMTKVREHPGDGMTVENGLHNALANTIMNNRSLFPPRAFSIKTDVPGGSIETEIPAYIGSAGQVKTGFNAAADKLTTLLSASSAEGTAYVSRLHAARAYGAEEA